MPGRQSFAGEKRTGSVDVLLAGLRACSRTRDLARGKQVHAEAVESGHQSNIYVASALINMYAKCGSIADARLVFDSVKHPDVTAWTCLILGYADNGQGLTGLAMFNRMKAEGLAPDCVAFVAALKACSSAAEQGADCRQCGEDLHHHVVKNGFDSSLHVQNALIDMYAKCGSMVDARKVFSSLQHQSLVAWNTLALGYAVNGQGLVSLQLFTRMKERGLAPDRVSFLAALKACSSAAVGEKTAEECRNWGKALHALSTENGCDSDIRVQSTLIDMYAKCGSMVEARQVFDAMQHPDVVPWTAVILGYADNGQGATALDLFTRMRIAGPAPSSISFLAALKACGLVGGLEFGRRIHAEIEASSSCNVFLVTCLVDFYAKCGSLVEAESILRSHAGTRNVATWTALLGGYSSCGDHESAFSLFEEMQDAGLLPDSAMVLCILLCCSHAGLVEKGKEFFDALPTKYGVAPAVDHYTCMLDMLGRANRLEDAMLLLRSMPCNPDDVTWRTVLCSCSKWKNVQLARLAFQSLMNLSSDKDAAAYVLMGQAHASKGMSQERERVLSIASEKPRKSCWTNETGEVHAFLVS